MSRSSAPAASRVEGLAATDFARRSSAWARNISSSKGLVTSLGARLEAFDLVAYHLRQRRRGYTPAKVLRDHRHHEEQLPLRRRPARARRPDDLNKTSSRFMAVLDPVRLVIENAFAAVWLIVG
jgi:hypothetical protein